MKSFHFSVIISIGWLTTFCTSQSQNPEKNLQNRKSNEILQMSASDSIRVINGVFDIPELTISVSPETACEFSFSKSENVVDYDVSPAGMIVAVITERTAKSHLKFWELGHCGISDSLSLPEGLVAKAITWHPMGNELFIMGTSNSAYQIFRIENKGEKWNSKLIFTSSKQLRRLVICPRPFITGYDLNTNNTCYAYRLFFGMDNGDKTFRIVSITEQGKKFYQVVGPPKSFTTNAELNAEIAPSEIESSWALPVAFHPAGHKLIWQDNNDHFFVASYERTAWGASGQISADLVKGGTITPTPNGLGLIHWQENKPGIEICLIPENIKEDQLPDQLFVSTPSSVPDGRGIIGLIKQNGSFTLKYAPVKVPLSDVQNAWMFISSGEELERFQRYNGLFRPNDQDQLYKLYETENYYCDNYDWNSPTRPYLVTTDIFWELFGAAYQGLFIVKERDGAIPNFRKFVDEANSHFKNSHSRWSKVFFTLSELYTNANSDNQEVQKIRNAVDGISFIHDKYYAYSELKPRGHYTSSPEMERYFKAFRYFTTILKDDQDAIRELEALPDEITRYAEAWINSYTGFIAPSISPGVWKNPEQALPGYGQYPQKEKSIFPLSWGFDNEVFYSTVYHEDFPKELQIKGTEGPRLMPSGLDIASALGNGFAEKLLESDLEKYPPLKKVINHLRENFKEHRNEKDFNGNLYNQWLNAIAVQWADPVNPATGSKENSLWNTKRLLSGLATWATLRHATVLVNEKVAAECGEAGFEAILMKAPRGYVEPDPFTFAAIGGLFEDAVNYVSKTIAGRSDVSEPYISEKRSLYDGIVTRLKEAAQEARSFQLMAEKEREGIELTNEENEKILYVARAAEHLFLIFNSLSNQEYALSIPDPMPKITDVAGDGEISPYLMAAVGNAMEWDFVVPFYGRKQIVKGSVYSYYEFASNDLLNDSEWKTVVSKQEFLPWVKPYITSHKAEGIAQIGY